ncbi:hypothetical protein IKG20_01915 [Candidatus Saccharibacteria bacterium]|nr:hypothetical protein [Candidatus Saccharibacteria bacterium]
MNEILTYASADVNIINISTDIGTMNVRNEETEEEPFVANAIMETVEGNRMIVPVSEEVAIKEELEEEPPIQRTFFIKAPNTGRK